jgi:hypothetical protein
MDDGADGIYDCDMNCAIDTLGDTTCNLAFDCEQTARDSGDCMAPDSGSIDFDYTGAEEAFTVPDRIHLLQIEAWGAEGGGDGRAGGLGGYVGATIEVTPGEVLHVFVGEKGPFAGSESTTVGGFNGGGAVLYGSISSDWAHYGGGGAGGGATDIRAAPYTLDDRLVVGGAGGSSSENGIGGAGGGGWSAGAGISGTYYSSDFGGGGVGGGGSTYYGGVDDDGDPSGTFGLGGDCTYWNYDCGAGGGGWYGGGAGEQAGGGGSSYTWPWSTDVVHDQGVRSGHGAMRISWGL